jgi:hypothetical protein
MPFVFQVLCQQKSLFTYQSVDSLFAAVPDSRNLNFTFKKLVQTFSLVVSFKLAEMNPLAARSWIRCSHMRDPMGCYFE